MHILEPPVTVPKRRLARVRPKSAAPAAAPSRQRQRLIDACITALHLYGPSRTTVAKVVAIARLSPGIVRFYFASKAAMLVASLEFLAAQFEDRVMTPVAQLRTTPIRALQLLVELYLDPDIASPRKVSVWYSFWGEASSRQEYYDICGKKDEDFARLVEDLIKRLIESTNSVQLDAEGIALGLIGVLEVLWQGIAFQSESSIDRTRARDQCMAYLRSVFPGHFDSVVAQPPSSIPALTAPDRAAHGAAIAGTALAANHLPAQGESLRPAGEHLSPWMYADASLLAAERERLLRPAWQVIGHAAQLPIAGDFLSAQLAGERALLVRDERGGLCAFRNSCRQRPHALVEQRSGHFNGVIRCQAHDLTYRLDGRLVAGDVSGDLVGLEVAQWGPLMVVRAVTEEASAATRTPSQLRLQALERMASVGERQYEVAADWKLIVERWLETQSAERQFLAPNQLLQLGRDAAVLLQVMPLSPGQCRIQRYDYATTVTMRAGARRQRAASPAGQSGRAKVHRATDEWLEQDIALAQSIQTGLAGAAETVAESGPVASAVAAFRRSIAALLSR